MTGNAIPTKTRDITNKRDGGRCQRCGGHSSDLHHRRRRGVIDEHTHAACNCVHLCTVCHAWAHASPKQAQVMGWIVSTDADPHDQPLHTFMFGWALLNHDGSIDTLDECAGCERITFTDGGLCMSCLRQEVCCGNATSAAAALCGCGGSAAISLRRLIDRVGEREVS